MRANSQTYLKAAHGLPKKLIWSYRLRWGSMLRPAVLALTWFALSRLALTWFALTLSVLTLVRLTLPRLTVTALALTRGALCAAWLSAA